jgi:hypothetical protein
LLDTTIPAAARTKNTTTPAITLTTIGLGGGRCCFELLAVFVIPMCS